MLIAPEYFQVAAVAFIPILIAYMGAKGAFQLALAAWRGRLNEQVSGERNRLAVVGALNAFLIGLFLYGWLVEANWIEVVHQTATFPGKLSTPSIRLVHISDLHIRELGKRERTALERIRSLEPDMICLTGDYMSGLPKESLTHARRFIGELEAPFGVYAVPGNWDDPLGAAFAGSRAHYLVGRSTEVIIRGTRVILTGSLFASTPPRIDASRSDGLNILLQHSPDLLEEASAAGYDLYLAGHTHGGQICLPWYGALITMSKFGKKYESGLFSMGGTIMYVSRGLGTEGGVMPELRLFCRPEITVLDLERGAE